MHKLFQKPKTKIRKSYTFPITRAKDFKAPLNPLLRKLTLKQFINIITAPKTK